MQTRIKIVENNLGNKTYYVQQRFDFRLWGLFFIPVIGWIYFISILFWDDLWNNWTSGGSLRYNWHSSLEDAKKSIDLFYEEIKREKQRKQEQKIKKTSYLRYP